MAIYFKKFEHPKILNSFTENVSLKVHLCGTPGTIVGLQYPLILHLTITFVLGHNCVSKARTSS